MPADRDLLPARIPSRHAPSPRILPALLLVALAACSGGPSPSDTGAPSDVIAAPMDAPDALIAADARDASDTSSPPLDPPDAGDASRDAPEVSPRDDTGPDAACAMVCDGGCTDPATDPLNCGACGDACPTGPNGTAVCIGGMCRFDCAAGFANCDTMVANGCEVDTRTDMMNCGGCSRVCRAPANATAAMCSAGACELTCIAGYTQDRQNCVRTPPRHLSPGTAAMVTTRRPAFRVELDVGQDGARFEVCSDSRCNTVVRSVDTVGASTGPLEMDLPRAGYFWRATGMMAGTTVTQPSVAWAFVVSAASAPGARAEWGPVFDFNGDRYGDTIIGAPESDQAQVYVHGTPPQQFVLVNYVRGPASTGRAVGVAGDVNGDSYVDAVVGAPVSNTVIVRHGSIAGLLDEGTMITAPTGVGDFGGGVNGVGDVTGDGYADIAVGSPASNRVDVYAGSADGIATVPSSTIMAPAGAANFGMALAGSCDVNADGFGDLVVSGDGSQSVYVYPGSAAGLASLPGVVPAPAGASGFGRSIACAGDVNGDGFPDVIVGAHASATAYVFHGSAAGLAATPATSLGVSADGLEFGYAVSDAGDVNGDGYSDVMVGAPMSARVYVYHGSAAGLGAAPSPSTTLAEGASTQLGRALAGMGDSNRDGFGDVVVGGPGTGTAYYWYGSATGVDFAFAPGQLGAGGGIGARGTAVASLGSGPAGYQQDRWLLSLRRWPQRSPRPAL